MKRTTLSMLPLVLLSTAFAQTTIKINGYAGQDPAIVGDLINKFVKPALAKDNVSVVYEPLQGDYNQQLTTLLAAGNAGDLFYVPGETLDGFVATGKLLKLTGLVSTSPFIKSLNLAFTRKGIQYAVAKDFNTLTLIYNKDLFDEAKVAYPDNNDTWTGLQNKLVAVKKALGNDYYGICLAPDFARMGQFAFAAGWKQFDSKGKTNLLDPAFSTAFNFFTGLAKNKVGVQPTELSQNWSGGCLGTGKVAVAIEGNWIVGFLKDNAPNLKYGTALIPKYDKNSQRGNFVYTVGWAINSGTKNKAAAVKVLNILTSPQVQQYVLEQGLAIPSRTALANNPFLKKTDPGALNSRAVFQGASDGIIKPYYFGTQGADWIKPINTALASVLSGQKSSADALKQAQSEMNTFQNR